MVGGFNHQQIQEAATQIFNFDYPFYGTTVEEQNMNRISFQTQFVEHNLMREIGAETPELWQIFLRSRLNDIMPYYSELYRTTLFELDINAPYHLVTTHNQKEQEKQGGTKNTGTTENEKIEEDTSDIFNNIDNLTRTINETDNNDYTSHSDMKHSDFPQASYTNGDYVSTEDVGTAGGNDTINRTGTDTDKRTQDTTRTLDRKNKRDRINNVLEGWDTTNNGTLDYIKDIKGHTSNAEILDSVEKWRNLIVNINMMIISDCADLFMGLLS